MHPASHTAAHLHGERQQRVLDRQLELDAVGKLDPHLGLLQVEDEQLLARELGARVGRPLEARVAQRLRLQLVRRAERAHRAKLELERADRQIFVVLAQLRERLLVAGEVALVEERLAHLALHQQQHGLEDRVQQIGRRVLRPVRVGDP
eukprot:4532856-Prymnesium_polylepis.2